MTGALGLRHFRNQQGNADAHYVLDIKYDEDQGRTINWVESLKWILRAAKQGHAGAKALKNKINLS
ncbi:MAG: hypothetical protein LBT47_00085 [Deltaproteobacteria bacterium]|jgi:TPR repeat protein|nr:hypothetical protein [Deltaproteobacteria bacterium]